MREDGDVSHRNGFGEGGKLGSWERNKIFSLKGLRGLYT